jgi:hypothetical protein
MSNMNRTPDRSPMAYWQRVHAATVSWHQSGFKDGARLEDAVVPLKQWLDDYPAQANDIENLALSTCYTANRYYLASTVEKFAAIGLDAALIRPMSTKADRVSAALLALLSAQAQLDQGKLTSGQDLVNFADQVYASLEPSAPIAAYIELHLFSLHGAFAEAVLETELAAEGYGRATKAANSLLHDDARLSRLSTDWVACVFGTGPELVANGAELSRDLLMQDLERTARIAVLGYARTIS